MADPTPGARMAIGAVERHAARAGAEIAAAGGNVVDAVIAAGFAQGVVNPVRAGIGGGGVNCARARPAPPNGATSAPAAPIVSMSRREIVIAGAG